MYLSIHPLDLGDLELDVSFANWQTGCGTKSWFPTTAWLVLDAQKPILVDSSFRSVEDALSNQGLTARRSQQQTLAYQLAKHGLNPADVGYVVHTHVHMDHSGKIFCCRTQRSCCSAKRSKMPPRRTFTRCPFMTG